jgi:hypothetical protein
MVRSRRYDLGWVRMPILDTYVSRHRLDVQARCIYPCHDELSRVRIGFDPKIFLLS